MSLALVVSAAAVLAILAAFVTVERLRLSQREHRRHLANDEATHIATVSSKASEQLGSDKAAVRIGGLTDLERLAALNLMCAVPRSRSCTATYDSKPTRKPQPDGEHVWPDGRQVEAIPHEPGKVARLRQVVPLRSDDEPEAPRPT